MTVAVGWVALTGWWIGIVVFLFVIVPVVAMLGNRLVSAARQIYFYAEHIAEHASGVVTRLEAAGRLEETRRLAGEVRENARRYVGAINE